MGAHLAALPARPPPGALTVPDPRRARTLPLRTSAAYVAVGTGVSRVTGLLRFVALAWALGQTTLADSYNLANTTPNMLYDVVLGGVLSATFIPVFVDRLSNKTEREAFDSISAVLTVSVVVLLGTTVAALVAAPFLIDALTVLDTHAGADQIHRVLLERQVATGFLRWFVIQIAAYGLFALAAALLNTRRRFIAVAWAPIVNNIVCIGILVWFGLWAGRGASLASVEQHHTQLVLLGLGTSLGVVLQGVALIPSLRRADLGLLRWRWNPRDEALRAVTRLGGWTFGFVLANQIALFVVTILAGSVAGPDPVSSYTYAYAFFQLPYGIVAVTVMSVVTPDLAERWSTGQQAAFLHRMTGGLRAVLALIIPSAVGMLLLAKPSVALLLGHGHSTPAETATTGAALAMFALGLPGLLHLPVPRARAAVDAAHQGRLLPLPGGERRSTSCWPCCSSIRSASAASRSRCPSPTPWRRCWRSPSSTSGSGGWPTATSWAPAAPRRSIASVPMGVVVLVVSNLSASTSIVGLPCPCRRLRGRRRPHLRRRRDLVGPARRGAPASPVASLGPGRTGPRRTGRTRRPRRPGSPAARSGSVRPVLPPGATRRVASSLDPPPPGASATELLPRRSTGCRSPSDRTTPTPRPRLVPADAPPWQTRACPASTSSPTVPAT